MQMVVDLKTIANSNIGKHFGAICWGQKLHDFDILYFTNSQLFDDFDFDILYFMNS